MGDPPEGLNLERRAEMGEIRAVGRFRDQIKAIRFAKGVMLELEE